jgi:hypothetical protein
VTLEATLFFAGLTAEACFVALIIFRRAFRVFPVFCSYIVWSLLNDAGGYYLMQGYPRYAQRIYLTAAIIDSIFVFAVLIELSMAVLRPVKSSLPRGLVVAVGFILALVFAAIWPFAKAPGIGQLSEAGRILIHLQLTTSALRILFFLALAVFSQWLSIGWRDRELQIATGFGFYSLASLSASLYHMNQSVGSPALGQQYHLIDVMVAASYACSMVYWIVCFAQEVPERREFTPQMESFLLALAGSARSTRIALADARSSKTGGPAR